MLSVGIFGGGHLGRLVEVAVSFVIAGEEADSHPAEDVIDHALRDADVGVGRVPHRLKPHVRELVDQVLQRHAVLQ